MLAHYLISRGVSKDEKDIQLHTPLHWAAYYGNAEMVMYLLNQGADKNAQDDCGCTPLHRACMKGHIEVVRQLCFHRANLLIKDAMVCHSFLPPNKQAN